MWIVKPEETLMKTYKPPSIHKPKVQSWLFQSCLQTAINKPPETYVPLELLCWRLRIQHISDPNQQTGEFVHPTEHGKNSAFTCLVLGPNSKLWWHHRSLSGYRQSRYQADPHCKLVTLGYIGWRERRRVAGIRLFTGSRSEATRRRAQRPVGTKQISVNISL